MSLDYLGTSWAYPLEVANGTVTNVSDKKLIEQSISDALNTPVGTKFFLGEYGSRLRKLLFEQNDEVLKDLLDLFIAETIKKWEKRIKLIGVSYTINGTAMECEITYRILNSNEVDSFIYPFYRNIKY